MTGIKAKAYLFIAQFRIRIQRIINRLPRQIRILGAPLLGGLVGLLGGIPGFFIGVLLGYLLGELFVQSGQERKVFDYFENPAFQQFYEGEPGLAAWCALGVLVASAEMESPEKVSAKTSPKVFFRIPGLRRLGDKSIVLRRPLPESSLPENILQRVILGASCVFTGPGAEPLLFEYFSHLAWSLKENLNPDLLAESLMARRIPLAIPGDGRNLGRGLSSLAGGEKAKNLAREICLILDPSMTDEAEDNPALDIHGNLRKDPWKILGLPPGTPQKEVKTHYRRLAKQFHPDQFALLEEKYRETAARAFVAIQEAYKEVSER
ncbi:MAG: J domain-containing protein [Treponema sp.]|nr:J domain-containing protein [Treponema sp.]